MRRGPHLQPQFQGHVQQRGVGAVVSRGGDLERVLRQFEDEGGGVDVALNGFQHGAQSQHVAWTEERPEISS